MGLKKDSENIVQAKTAMDKYEAWYAEAVKKVEDKKFFAEENAVYWGKPVSVKEIEKAETRLGLKLPPSYVKFVTESGVFNFGAADSCESAIHKPTELDPITVTLETEFGMDVNEEFSEKEISDMNKIIRFSFGDENRQLVYCYVFRLDLRKDDEGEAVVSAFDQDEMEETWSEPYDHEPRSFDEHINRIVEEKIKTAEEYIEEGRYN